MVDQKNARSLGTAPEKRYELSWTWRSAAMGCHAALEEVGADYAMRFIDFEKPWPEEDLDLNPNRKVPTLVDRAPRPSGEGPAVIYQSAAILLYLADNHPEANLTPAPGTAPRGQCYQWLFFMAEMLQPSYHMFYYPERHTTMDDDASRQAVQSKAIEWINELWRRIDHAIGDKTCFLGDEFSVCDLYMLPMASWNDSNTQFMPIDIYMNLSRVLSNARARPSVQRMLESHIRS